MALVVEEITLDISKVRQFVTVRLQQGDANTRALLINILDDGEIFTIPTGSLISLSMMRSNNTPIYNSCALEDNKAKITITSAMTEVAGLSSAKIIITDSVSGGELATIPFKIIIEEEVIPEEMIVTTGEFTVLENSLLEVAQYKNRALQIGDLTQLLTTSNTDLVGGINENKGSIDTIKTDVGDKTSLLTTIKTSIVNAINEIVSKVGDIAQLATTVKTSIVDAINELKNSKVSKVDLYVNVKDYGAKGDGTTDDTTAIQSAINSLGYYGGKVFFPKGIYIIKDTLTIGNGSATANSTLNCITLEGVSDAVTGGAVYDGGFGTMIRYGGTVGKPMIRILGAINSPTIRGITLDGYQKATHGIWATCALRGKFESVSIRDTTQYGILLDIYAGFTETNTINNMYCTIRDSWINLANSPYATCIKLSGVLGADTNMALFENLFLLYSGTSGRGLYLGFCDSNLFTGVHCYRQGADNGSAYSIIFDGLEVSGYPDALTFLNFSATNDDIAYYGTVGNITFYNYMTGDGAVVPVNAKTRGTTSTGQIFGNWTAVNDSLIQKQTPRQVLKINDSSFTNIYKNSNGTNDYGTVLQDKTGTTDTYLTLQNGSLVLSKTVNGTASGTAITIATIV